MLAMVESKVRPLRFGQKIMFISRFATMVQNGWAACLAIQMENLHGTKVGVDVNDFQEEKGTRFPVLALA
jgi:hypothetical protein